MSFSDDAIGFFLQLEDQLTPALATAGESYGKFVKSLDKHNQRAFASANKGFDRLTGLVESFEQLPKTAAKAYDKAAAMLKKRVKPIIQKVGLDFSPRSQKQLGKAVSQAVVKALSKVNIRMTATAPLKRSKFFDTSIPLRASYKKELQPPDMLGRFQNLPRFAEGGEVPTGGKKPGSIDQVLALLTEGEIVLPKDVSAILKEMTKRKALPKGLSESLLSVLKLETRLKDLQDAVDLGLDSDAPKKFKTGLVDLDKGFKSLLGTVSGMSKGKKALIPMLKDAKSLMEGFKDAGKSAQPVYKKLLEKILGPARFLAINTALGDMQEGFRNVTGAAQDTAMQLGVDTDTTISFFENVMEANKILGINRKEFKRWAQSIVLSSRAQFGGMVSSRGLGEAFLALTKAGVRSREELDAFTPVVDMLSVATGEDPGGLAHTFYRLSDAYNFTRDQAVAYMLTLKNVAAVTATDLGQLQDQMTENLKGGLGAFLQTIKSTETQKTVLENFAKISGALTNQWGDTGGQMAQRISDALTDPRAAADLSKFLGIQQNELMATLQREGGAEEVVRSLSKTIKSTFGSGGDVSSSLSIFKDAFSFEGSVAELQRLITSSDDFDKQAEALRGTTVRTADAMNGLKEATDNAKGGWKEFKDSVGTFITGNIPAEVLDFLGDFNLRAISSSILLVSQLGPAIAGVGKVLKADLAVSLGSAGSGIKNLFPTVGKLRGGLSSLMSTIVNVSKSLIGNTLTLGKNAVAWIASKAVMIATAIATKVVTAAQWLFNAALTANPIGLVVVGVAALIAGFVLLADRVGGFGNLWSNTIEFWVDLFKTVFDWVASFGDKLLFLLGPIGAVIFAVRNFGEIWDFVGEKASGVWGGIKDMATSALMGVKDLMNEHIINPFNALISAINKVPGVNIPSIPTLEKGGGVMTPQMILAGEKPEVIIPLDKMKGVLGAAAAEGLRQEMAKPLPTAGEIREAIMVKMDPSSTDRPVLDAIKEQTKVMREVLSAVITGRDVAAPVLQTAGTGPRTVRGAGGLTSSIARGEF